MISEDDEVAIEKICNMTTDEPLDSHGLDPVQYLRGLIQRLSTEYRQLRLLAVESHEVLRATLQSDDNDVANLKSMVELACSQLVDLKKTQK